MFDFCNFRKNNPRDRKKNPSYRIEIYLLTVLIKTHYIIGQ